MVVVFTTCVAQRHIHTSRFEATVCKTVCHMLSVGCLSVSPVCDVGVLWPNGWTDHNETWHTGRPGLGPGHIVLDGNLAPPPHKGARGGSPNFQPITAVAKWLDGSRCDLVRS